MVHFSNAQAISYRHGDSGNMAAAVFGVVFLLLYLALILYSLNWLYKDVEERGKNGCLITLLVALFAWPVGLLIWYVARPNRKRQGVSAARLQRQESCKRCGYTIPAQEAICPYCKHARK